MAWQMAAATIAAPIVGGIVGNIMSKKDRAAARAALERGMKELDAIGLPPDLSKRIIYDQFQQVGILTPELEEDIELADTKVKLIKEAPELQEAQMDALSSIMERGKVGLTDMERAELNQIREQVQTDAQAKAEQIIQQMAARGQSSPLLEAVLQQKAAQDSADRASMEGDRLVAMATQNALAAMSQGGQMAGQMQQQQFGRNLARAEAEDKFNLQDWAAKNARQSRNIDRTNIAQQQNLSEQQRIADENTRMENTERLRMEQAKRNFWRDKLNRAQAYMGAGAQQADAYSRDADRKAQMFAGMGSAIGQGLNAYSQRRYRQSEADKNSQLMGDIHS